MSTAVKSLPALMKRAKLIAEMGLVHREEHGFNVKSPSRNKENNRVWRDERGRVRCSCVDFEAQSQQDARYRCEHIMAVKFYLEPPVESSPTDPDNFSADVNESEAAAMAVDVAHQHQEAKEIIDQDSEDPLEGESAVAFSQLLRELSTPIPREFVRQRVGWTDRNGQEHEIDYVEWHTVADLLDRIYPEWSHSVKHIQPIGDLVAVTASINIRGITREGIGTGSAYDEKGIKKAEHDALKRAAVKFGIARELYKKDEDDAGAPAVNPPALRIPRDPVAKNISEMATAKQHAAIRAIANAQGVDVESECLELFHCRLAELSRRAASAFIDHLKSKQSLSA